MPGVDAERVSQSDTHIGLLSYFQEATRTAWDTHRDKHDLEDKALALAVNGVKEALELAVKAVRDEQKALRELLESRINALSAQTVTFNGESLARWDNHALAHAAQEQRGLDWVASVTRLEEEKQHGHEQIHAASQRAIDIADRSMTDKLGEMNNLRQQITAERGTYVNRDMLDARVTQVLDQIAALGKRMDDQTTGLSKASDTRLSSLERSQNIAYGIMLVLVFAIPIGLKFLP